MLISFTTYTTMPLMVNALNMIVFQSMLNFNLNSSTNTYVSIHSSTSILSMSMTTLTLWITMLMMLSSMNYQYLNTKPTMFQSLFKLMMTLIIFFTTDNLLMFYLMFEVSLIPTLILILKWGYQPERLQASFYFIMYTVCASIPLLVFILKTKTTNMSWSMMNLLPLSCMESKPNFTPLNMMAMTAFLVKMPTWSVHLWLPKAHVEAPLAGSMILAGLLLKLGGMGLIKIMKMMYKMTTQEKELIMSMALWGATLMTLMCLTSTDMKTLIAYSSIVHMNTTVLAILTNSLLGLTGSILMMILHGINSPGMFTMASMNYEKTKTRNLILQKGINLTQPTLMMPWFLLIMGNMATPPSANLIAEILINSAIMKTSFWLFPMLMLITTLSAAYNLFLYSAQQSQTTKLLNPSTNTNSTNHLTNLMQYSPLYMITLMIQTIT
nr:NADH dehydrogenase subunit 4 [Cupuladria biporosa]